MKKFFKKLSDIGCLFPFIIGGLFPVVGIFVGIWKFCGGDIKLFIINATAVPFVFIGLLNIIRGACAVLAKDQANFDFKKYWHFAIYVIITIAGYVAVALAIAQFLSV